MFFNPFPNKPWFLRVCSTSLLKTLWEKEKLLATSNFSFSHSVFYSFGEFLPFSSNMKLTSANSFNLEKSKICCLGKGWLIVCQNKAAKIYSKKVLMGLMGCASVYVSILCILLHLLQPRDMMAPITPGEPNGPNMWPKSHHFERCQWLVNSMETRKYLEIID